MIEYRLINGSVPEALEQLATGACSIVIADPPYCSGANTAGKRTVDVSQKYVSVGGDFTGDSMSERVFSRFTVAWMRECARIVSAGYLFCFIDWRMWPVVEECAMRGGWSVVNMLIWNKGRGRVAPENWGGGHELILMARIGTTLPTHAGTFYGASNVLGFNRVNPSHKEHMSQKPVELLMELLRARATDHRPVLDPFAGSGSTMLAASRRQRPSIMVEQDPAHCATIRKNALMLTHNDALGNYQDIAELAALTAQPDRYAEKHQDKSELFDAPLVTVDQLPIR